MGIPNVWNPFYENHHRRHIVIVSVKQQVENDDTNDGTSPFSENAVQTLMLNSLSAIFISYPDFLHQAGFRVKTYACKSSSISSTSSRCYKINLLEWTVFGRSRPLIKNKDGIF